MASLRHRDGSESLQMSSSFQAPTGKDTRDVYEYNVDKLGNVTSGRTDKAHSATSLSVAKGKTAHVYNGVYLRWITFAFGLLQFVSLVGLVVAASVQHVFTGYHPGEVGATFSNRPLILNGCSTSAGFHPFTGQHCNLWNVQYAITRSFWPGNTPWDFFTTTERHEPTTVFPFVPIVGGTPIWDADTAPLTIYLSPKVVRFSYLRPIVLIFVFQVITCAALLAPKIAELINPPFAPNPTYKAGGTRPEDRPYLVDYTKGDVQIQAESHDSFWWRAYWANLGWRVTTLLANPILVIMIMTTIGIVDVYLLTLMFIISFATEITWLLSELDWGSWISEYLTVSSATALVSSSSQSTTTSYGNGLTNVRIERATMESKDFGEKMKNPVRAIEPMRSAIAPMYTLFLTQWFFITVWSFTNASVLPLAWPVGLMVGLYWFAMLVIWIGSLVLYFPNGCTACPTAFDPELLFYRAQMMYIIPAVVMYFLFPWFIYCAVANDQ